MRGTDQQERHNTSHCRTNHRASESTLRYSHPHAILITRQNFCYPAVQMTPEDAESGDCGFASDQRRSSPLLCPFESLLSCNSYY